MELKGGQTDMNENEKKIDGVETPVEDTAVQQPAEPKKSGRKAFG